MSPNDRTVRRHGTPSESLDEQEGRVDAWLDAVIYYGLGQQMLLTLPVLWIAFQTVRTPVAVTTSAIVSLAVASLTIGAFRVGKLSTAHPWHRIEDNEIGLGPRGGYGFFVRRAAYLNATLGLGTFTGATVDAGGGGLLGAILVAGGVTFGALYVLPNVRAISGNPSVLVRCIFYAVSLAVVAAGGQVLDFSVGMPSGAFAFAVVCLFVVFDVGVDLF